MKKIFRFGKLAAILLGVLILFMSIPGCKKEKQAEPGQSSVAVSGEHLAHEAPEQKPKAEKTLYNCPMHPSFISDKPGECSICGMDLVPVKAEEKQAPKKKIIYRSTMNPNEVSDKPGKDSMGMEMVPFEVEEQAKSPEMGERVAIQVSPERLQTIGVKTAAVIRQPLHRTLKIAGRLDFAEPSVFFVNLKFEGWVENLYIDTTGKMVKKGDPLLSIYSPDLVSAQQEYLLAAKAKMPAESGQTLLKSAREKLSLWDISDAQVQELERTGQAKRILTIYSPGDGFVIEKNVLQGQKVMSGENLYKIADLSRVWIYGEVYEYELPFIKRGQEVRVSLSYYPEETFSGRITYIYPYLSPETRTNKVRIEAANPGYKLKPEMFANLEIHVDYGIRLTVPVDAVLDAGDKKFVFVDKGQGFLEPREIKVGVKGEDVYDVKSGVIEGEKVITSANFLIDSESSLKAALKKLTKSSKEEHRHD